MDWNGLGKYLRKRDFEVIGITSTTMLIKNSLKALDVIKSISPNSFTVMGGPHPSAIGERLFDDAKDLDCVVYGEGEDTTLELVQNLSKGKSIENVQGIIYRRGGEIKKNPPRPLIPDVDTIPFPARHLLPMEKYTKPASILTSRSCPYRCIYCLKGVFGRTWRGRSYKNVVDEMEFLVDNYNFDKLAIVDDIFNYDMNRAEKICDEIIKRELEFKWHTPNGIRVDRVNKQLFKKMKKAGCVGVQFGVESGSQKILNNIKKGTTLNMIRRAVQAAKEEGLGVSGSFMIGNPGESWETVRESVEFMKELDIGANFNMTTPYPGTVLWRWIEENGRFITTDFKKFAQFEASPAFETEDFSVEDRIAAYNYAVKERNKLLLKNALSPAVVFNAIFSLRSLDDLKKKIKFLYQLISGKTTVG
jgi:anaerobic magnesium-protoporphyrin IX monomethyl ester cyclase